MTTTVEDLLSLLDLENIEVNIFRGHSPDDRWQRVFGGQVIGQALVAAQRTVDDRFAHSLHAYFLLAGDPKVPILYDVDRIRDGKSFTTRRVRAIQHGRPIFTMSVSFQRLEDGVEHQIDMPDGLPPPEDLPTEREMRMKIADRLPEEFRERFTRDRPVELRPVEPYDMLSPKKRPPVSHVWFRATQHMPDDVALHQCALAYASDMTLLDTSFNPHGITFINPKVQSASLDHAMWFHRAFRADEWLLYVQDSPSASGARGFNRGSIYTRDGKLVASVAQEGLVRIHD